MPSAYASRRAGGGGQAGGAPAARASVAPPAESARRLEALGYGGGDDESDNHLGLMAVPLAQESAREPLTREQVVVEVERLLAATRLAPGESPRDMFFRYFGDAPFRLALEDHTSTFAVDVDTASYALARGYLKQGQLPPRASVRTEEFVNYFKADLAPPTDGKPFAIALELAPSLFAKDARTEMLRVGVRAKDVADFERKPVALTFVIDNSGSMREGDRLELVKRSLALLLRQLYAGDSVAVVKFSNEAAVVTPALPATRRGELEALIGALPIEGGTNVEAGLRLGYQLAVASLQPNMVNRVVLCSDGVGNIGETSAQGLLALVKEARAKGVYLNTVGVGMGNHNDAFLEQLADEGDGVCNYVDSDAEAKRVFVDGLASALQPVARDVKIQVEFDPAQVESWRLLGYENRALRTQDFRNDKIDAGEVNAGHQVSALYELVRRPSRSGPLATVRLRYKPPFAIDGGKQGSAAREVAEQALELERTLSASAVLPGFAAASNGTQRSVLVAQFAEVLRRSVHARGDSLATLVREAQRLDKALGDPDFTEFVALLALANPLLDARDKEETPRVQVVLDELSRLRYEQALREREHELARQAGEPEKDLEARLGRERETLAARDAIQRLEDELRALVGGSESQSHDLDGLGYGGAEKKKVK
jgi:Ca-activated chloride channel homolog